MKRRLIIISAIVAVVAIVWTIGHIALAPPPLGELATAWPRGLGSLNDFAKRYPAHEASTNANEVVRIAAKLDIDLAPLQPRSKPPETMRKLRQSFLRYLTSEVAASTDAIEEPPPGVKQYLDAHRAAIDELTAQLVANAEPRWTMDIQELWSAPEPNGSGHFDLFMVLASDALQRRRAGDDDAAWRDLAAMWKIARGLWTRPEYSIAMSGTRLMNDVAWKMRAPAPPWWREVEALDVERAVTTSMQYEVWRFVEMARRYPAGEPEDSSPHDELRRAAGIFLAPLRLRHAEAFAHAARTDEEAAAKSRACSGGDYGHRRARRFIAEREGVSKLLALKAAGWPASLPGIERSVCSDRTWTYANGVLTISRPIPTEEQQRVVLPLTWHH